MAYVRLNPAPPETRRKGGTVSRRRSSRGRGVVARMTRRLGVGLIAAAGLLVSGCGSFLPSGIAGQVTATADCPHGTPCAADPNLQVWVTVSRLPRRVLGLSLGQTSDVVARVLAGGGEVRLFLLPGRYVVSGDPGGVGENGDTCRGQVAVTVRPHRMTPLAIDCEKRMLSVG